MKYKKVYLMFILFNVITAQANEFDVTKFRNDKEVRASVLFRSDFRNINKLFNVEELKDEAEAKLFETFETFELNQGPGHCDLKFIELLSSQKSESFLTEIKLARINNSIDDVMYEILINANKDIYVLRNSQHKMDEPNYNSGQNRFVLNNNLERLYKDFSVWPDNITKCTRTVYNKFIGNIKNNRNLRPSDLTRLHAEAFKRGLISIEIYYKLKALQKLKSFKYPLTVKSYFNLTQKVKNVLAPDSPRDTIRDLSKQAIYPSVIINKKKRLTRRKALLFKYSATEIVMMAQVLRNTARRMGADPDYNLSQAQIVLNFEYELESMEERNYVETYELSAQDQYSLARNLLKRDIRKLSTIKSFVGKKIKYNEIIMAALETGYITHEDIRQVTKYDDLFNSNYKSRWTLFKNFTLRALGTSTLYLPTPLNIVGSIAMVIIEAKIKNKNPNGANHDNSSSLIN